jgi:hypothetical protein
MKDLKDEIADSLNRVEIPVRPEEVRTDPRRKQLLILLSVLLVLIVAYLYMFTGLPSANFGNLRLYSSSEELGQGKKDHCASTEYCLMIYFRPPCRECSRLKPMLSALQTHVFKGSSNIGVVVVVGGKDEAASLRVASALPGEIFFDYDDGIPEKLTVTRTPAWILREKSGKLVYLEYGVPDVSGSPVEKARMVMQDYISKRKGFD